MHLNQIRQMDQPLGQTSRGQQSIIVLKSMDPIEDRVKHIPSHRYE